MAKRLALKSWWLANGFHYSQYFFLHRKKSLIRNTKIGKKPKQNTTLLTESKTKQRMLDLSLTQVQYPGPAACQLCESRQVPPLSEPVSSAPCSWNSCEDAVRQCVSAVLVQEKKTQQSNLSSKPYMDEPSLPLLLASTITVSMRTYWGKAHLLPACSHTKPLNTSENLGFHICVSTDSCHLASQVSLRLEPPDAIASHDSTKSVKSARIRVAKLQVIYCMSKTALSRLVASFKTSNTSFRSFQPSNEFFKVPGKRRPGSIQVIAPRCQVKLDVGQLVELAHDVRAQLWLQKGAPCVVPVTAGKHKKGSSAGVHKARQEISPPSKALPHQIPTQITKLIKDGHRHIHPNLIFTAGAHNSQISLLFFREITEMNYMLICLLFISYLFPNECEKP